MLITKNENWSCGRCLDKQIKSNTNNIFYISENYGNMSSNSFYQMNEYVVDFGDYFLGLKKEDFDKDYIIEKWKKININ